MGFTDYFYKEMLTNLISFSSRYTFLLNLLLKASVVWAEYYEFLQFFLRGQPYWLRDISETSEWNSTAKSFSASTWFIHFYGICNYLHSFQNHPALNFFENKCCFPDQEHLYHYINKSTETGLEFFIKYFLRAISCGSCCHEGILLLFLVVVVAIVVVVLVVVVVAVMVVIVLVPVVVVVKSCPGLVNTNCGPYPGSGLVNTI